MMTSTDEIPVARATGSLVTQRTAAAYLGITYDTMRRWYQKGSDRPRPASVRVGSRRMFRVADLDKYITNRTEKATR